MLRLRTLGWSYPEIGEELNISPSAAYASARKRMSFVFVEGERLALELKQEAGTRLDLLMRRWLPLATNEENPNATAAAIVLKIIERQARLFGLDEQPELKVEVDNRTIVVTSELLNQYAAEARKALEHEEE